MHSYFNSGNVNDDIDFEYDEGTIAHDGCGATLFGQFWYFGGYGTKKRQVSINLIWNKRQVISGK